MLCLNTKALMEPLKEDHLTNTPKEDCGTKNPKQNHSNRIVTPRQPAHPKILPHGRSLHTRRSAFSNYDTKQAKQMVPTRHRILSSCQL
ncbi:hypothetical protein MJO28_001600 [Puccinia striiformis f. sp. tritici]|uniref:Uncharacterized protein n=1 Tax=Puccinia striiformis f. sp. tritici TaxID=168172 RepID=A0ACC0EV41_9BASI|nr:hypothetical protein MJO28_017495 [Puccinia striiformis f. sp. tritici]KAI7961111.1 hypothetical protein MJO28_001600 [Puccinia striiformis f. sp. tritici]